MVKRTSSFYTLKATEGRQVRYTVTSRQFKSFPIVAHITGGTIGFYAFTASQKGITYTLKASDKNIEYTLYAPILRGNNADYIIKATQPKQAEYVLKSTNTAVQEYVLKAEIIRGFEANHAVKAIQPKTIEYTVFAKTKPSVSYPIVSTNRGVTFELKNPTLAVRSTTKLVSIYDSLSAEKSEKVSELMYIAQCASADDKNTLISSIKHSASANELFAQLYSKQHAIRNRNQNVAINAVDTSTSAHCSETDVQKIQETAIDYELVTAIDAIKNVSSQSVIDMTIAEFKAAVAVREFMANTNDVNAATRLSELYGERIIDIAEASIKQSLIAQISDIADASIVREQDATPSKPQSSNVVHEVTTKVTDTTNATVNHIVDTSVNEAQGGVIIKGTIDLVKHQTAVTEHIKQLNHTHIKVPQHKREQIVHHTDLKATEIALEQQLHHIDKTSAVHDIERSTDVKEPQTVVPNREVHAQRVNIKESTKNCTHNILLSNVKDATRLSIENIEIIEVQTSVTGRILQTTIADKERVTIKHEARTNVVNHERTTVKREHITNVVNKEKATIKRIQNTNITDLERAIRDNQLHTHIANIEKGLRDKTLHATIVNPERSVHADKLTKITKFKESVRITELKTTIDDPVLALKPEKKKKKQIWLRMGKSSWLQGWKHWKTR